MKSHYYCSRLTSAYSDSYSLEGNFFSERFVTTMVPCQDILCNLAHSARRDLFRTIQHTSILNCIYGGYLLHGSWWSGNWIIVGWHQWIHSPVPWVPCLWQLKTEDKNTSLLPDTSRFIDGRIWCHHLSTPSFVLVDGLSFLACRWTFQ